MSVKLRPSASANPPEEYVGLTVDTVVWLGSAVLPDGSTYREIDGEKRMWEAQDGVWYPQ